MLPLLPTIRPIIMDLTPAGMYRATINYKHEMYWKSNITNFNKKITVQSVILKW